MMLHGGRWALFGAQFKAVPPLSRMLHLPALHASALSHCPSVGVVPDALLDTYPTPLGLRTTCTASM